MSKTFLLLSAAAVMGLSGCLSATSSEFADPNGTSASAVIPVDLDVLLSGQVYDNNLGGAAYLTGIDPFGVRAYAGVMPDSWVGSDISSGTAIYLADYEVAYVFDVDIAYKPFGTDALSGSYSYTTGQITLVFDADAGTLTGTDNALTINGTVSGGDITGTSTFAEVDGELVGIVGSEGTVGAVHGHSDALVYAGGFVGAKN
ncbi:MAG: hypothetical protein P8X77_16980 [Maritimibacter sp.]|jgi:hypothetical protein